MLNHNKPEVPRARKIECEIFKLVVVITFMSISSYIAFTWMAQVPTVDKSTLVQVIAWYRQAKSRYLSQYWPNSKLHWQPGVKSTTRQELAIISGKIRFNHQRMFVILDLKVISWSMTIPSNKMLLYCIFRDMVFFITSNGKYSWYIPHSSRSNDQGWHFLQMDAILCLSLLFLDIFCHMKRDIVQTWLKVTCMFNLNYVVSWRTNSSCMIRNATASIKKIHTDKPK